MDEVYKQGFALIIGVGADLPNTINDAVGLADILKDPSRCAYPDQQVHLLVSEQATRTNILTALDTLAQSTDSKSTVIVYFSGHGYRVTSPTGEFYYLMPYGYQLTRLYQTAISGAEFTQRLRAIPAQKLLVLLDCCHAGGVGDAKVPGLQLAKSPLPPETQSLLAEGSGRVIIASSQEDELSYAGKPYSTFTLALIETLCGIGVGKKDGYVRVADLAMHSRQVVPQRTSDKQHPVLHFEQADNFVLAYYASGDTQSKGLPFASEPAIEPAPGAWTAFNQRGQTVQGSQTNIAGDAHGTVFSGNFPGSVEVGKNETLNMQGGFYQPEWNVRGDVMQAQRDIVIGSRDINQGGDEALVLVFTNLMGRIKLLPADDQAVIKPIAEQARVQAEKIQQGDNNAETQNALEKRLKSLFAMTPDLGEEVIDILASSSTGIANVIQKIAKRVQGEAKRKSE
jgi:hypothetical protein